MKGGPKYRVPHRRRREGKTDYRTRLKLLKSGLPRFVVRRSNRNILCQVIEHRTEGDIVITSAHSCQLKQFGWKVACGNIPAAYLVGLLVGKRAKEKGIKRGILDTGLYDNVKGTRIYAVLKGILDAGIAIPHSPEILPSEERLRGEHIAKWAEKMKTEPEKYKRYFSEYLHSMKPEDIVSHFNSVKERIMK
ncbi:MAG: 50S ribosomal protein L18 [Candidatus Aenigmatarchaeota archaeon]